MSIWLQIGLPKNCINQLTLLSVFQFLKLNGCIEYNFSMFSQPMMKISMEFFS